VCGQALNKAGRVIYKTIMNWHYVEHGQQVGPVTEEVLTQLFQAGRITADTLVWHEGLPDWQTYHQAMANRPPVAGVPPIQPAAAPIPLNENEVVCAECGKIFPAGETIKVGQTSVCASCKPVFLQKLSEGVKINTGTLNYAGFWIRFAAVFVDGLILGLPFMIVYFATVFPSISAASHRNGQPPQFAILPLLEQMGFYLVQWGYTIFFIGKYGATPGKMACKLKVVTAEGEKVSYARATGRCFAQILSAMICYIGYIMVGFDDQKRALHDHICNTRVVYK
jgi:uncharacterized RDD family membrane protein YckC